MHVYATEPPWEGRSSFGYWKKGEELWDGTSVWTFVPAGAKVSLTQLSNVLRNYLLPPLQRDLNRGSLLPLLLKEFEGVTPSTSRTSRATTKWSSVRSFLSAARFRSSTTRRSSRD